MNLRGYCYAIAATTGVFLAGCSSSSTDSGRYTPPDRGSNYAISVLTDLANHDTVARLFTPSALTEAMPTVRYFDGSVYLHSSTLVATGTFESFRVVEIKQGHDPNEPDEGSEAATWPAVVANFHVVKPIASSAEGRNAVAGTVLPITFYLSGNIDAVRFGGGLVNLGNTVAFLLGGFSGSNSWSIAEGSLLGTVSSDGRIRMGVDLEKRGKVETTSDIRVDVSTVAELEAAATRPRIINVGPPAPTDPVVAPSSVRSKVDSSVPAAPSPTPSR